MKLTDATEGKEYIVNSINTKDEELNAFLFSLGCYSGEPITVISRKHGGMVVSIKAVSYTHLDVYKRQLISRESNRLNRSIKC